MNAPLFDSDLLRTFAFVVEEGGFTRAAKRLHLTQSAVSVHVRRLEEQAGTALLVRSTRALALTRDGEALLGYARAITRLNESARACLSRRDLAGTLSIGTSEDFASEYLPRILLQFAERFPRVALEVRIGITGSLLEQLDQSVDVVIGSRCGGHRQGQTLWREPLIWACSERYQIHATETVPLALYPPPCPYREAALAALSNAGRQWRVVLESPSVAGVRAAVLAGLAVAPITRGLLGSNLREARAEDALPSLPEAEFVLFMGTRGEKLADALADVVVSSVSWGRGEASASR